VLCLSHNKLTELPDEIGELACLERLELGFNELTSLPQSIGQLADLSELNASNNQIFALPSTLDKLVTTMSMTRFLTLPRHVPAMSWHFGHTSTTFP